MRISVLTQGHYEDRTILGVFLNHHTAQQAQMALTQAPYSWHPDMLDLVQESLFGSVNDFLDDYQKSVYCPKNARIT